MAAAMDSISARDPDFIGADQTKLVPWQGIIELFRRPYWRRVWVMQEATSPSRPDVLCGRYRFPWATLQHINILETRLSNLNLLPSVQPTDFKYATLLDELWIKRGQNIPIPFLSCLQSLRMCASTDPRDKVYAAMGFASDLMDATLAPDYTKTVEEVYTDVATLFLSRSDGHQLDFLGHTVNRAGSSETIGPFDEDFLTWLPDWRNRIEITPFCKRYGTGDKSGEKVYRASGLTPVLASIDGRKLIIQGSPLTRIGAVSKSLDWPDEIALPREWLPDDWTGTYVTGEDVQTAFRRTLVADFRNVSPMHRNFQIA